MKRTGRKHRRVAVVTGTRAEYGLLTSVMQAIRARRDLELQLVVTGMHLLKKFGTTISQIKRDGWSIDARVPMQRGDDSPIDQAWGLSRGIAGMAEFFESARTNIVVVLGDRIEALAGALAAVTTGRILAHIHGGDVAAGDFDDSVRHAISKLAHLHFPASLAAAGRIVSMGEAPSRVHMVGAPGLDRLRELVAQRGRIRKSARSALIVQHPIGRSAAEECAVMSRILKAANAAGLCGMVVAPNSDRGHSGIRSAIDQFIKAQSRFSSSSRVRWEEVTSLPRDEYLNRLLDVQVLIGNSSSGMIEAGVAGTAVINIGDRQRGREHDAGHVIHCGESAAAITSAIGRACAMKRNRLIRSNYGNEPAGPKIADALASIAISEGLRRKTLEFTLSIGGVRPNERTGRGR